MAGPAMMFVELADAKEDGDPFSEEDVKFLAGSWVRQTLTLNYTLEPEPY